MRYELYHHGIKGQRWGVRRYQNPDGSLTSAGRKRYNDSIMGDKSLNDTVSRHIKNRVEAKRVKNEKFEKVKNGVNTAKDILAPQVMYGSSGKSGGRDYSQMSEKELRDTINRRTLEKQLKDLDSTTTKSGKATLDYTLKTVGTLVTITGGTLAIIERIKNMRKS